MQFKIFITGADSCRGFEPGNT